MKALISGGGGFIGSQLRARLATEGWHVATMGRTALPGRHHSVVDVRDERRLREILAAERPDVVFHAAGTARSGSVEELYSTNVFYAVNLLAAVGGVTPEARVLLLGSAAEYGDPGREPVKETAPAVPLTPYGISKLAQTLHGIQAARRGLHVTTCRLFNVVGPEMPRHLALGAWAAQMRQARDAGGPRRLSVGNLKSWRDFVDVRDVVEVLIRLARLPAAAGAVVNVGSGRAEQMESLLRRLIELSETPMEVVTEAPPSAVDVPYIVGCTHMLRGLVGQVPRGISDDLLRRCLVPSGSEAEGTVS